MVQGAFVDPDITMKNLSSIILLTVLMLSSAGCLKTPKIKSPFSKSDPMPAEPALIGNAPAKVEWIAAQNQPGAFLPKGYDSSAPTSADHGEWVNRGEGQYFVPFRGVGEADYVAIVLSLPVSTKPERKPAAEFASKISPSNLLPVRARTRKEKSDSEVDKIWETES
ncbi:MAG: hypothetical protein ACI8UO_003989 [Verrucomicrobiales bacterium]